MPYKLKEIICRKEFVVTVEVEPPRGADVWGVYKKTRTLAQMVDVVNIADSPTAKLRMSPIALAHLVQQELKLPAIFHLTCRDRNVIGLQSELLGAHALGVKNILSMMGDSPKLGDHPCAKGVYEVDTPGLIRIAKKLNSGTNMMGKPINGATDFFIGAVANPNANDINRELERFKIKVDAGAEFFQTQPIFDVSRLEYFLEKTHQFNVPVIFGLMPLKSVKLARYLNKNVPGFNISQVLVDRLDKGGRQEGYLIACELFCQMKKITRGIHIFPMGDIALVESLLKETNSGERGKEAI